MSRKKKVLRKIGMRDVEFIRIANRRGYAAIAKNCLTEGSSVYQAYSRLVKACRRIGYDLPIKTSSALPGAR